MKRNRKRGDQQAVYKEKKFKVQEAIIINKA